MRLQKEDIAKGFALLRLESPSDREAIQKLRNIHKPQPAKLQESITAAHTSLETIEVPRAELE